MEAICSMYSEVLGLCLSRFWREVRNALAGIFRLATKLYSAPVTAAAERAAINERAGYILDTYGDSILRYAYSYLHNMSDAEDILQDTLIQYLKTGPVFENAAHEKAWLLRVAANLRKNRLDYNSIRKTDELNEELAADERGDLSFVWEAVKSLPVKYREVIHLFYHEGCSVREISNILKRPEATVRSDLHRGRERLREILREEYDFDEAL